MSLSMVLHFVVLRCSGRKPSEDKLLCHTIPNLRALNNFVLEAVYEFVHGTAFCGIAVLLRKA